MNKRFSLTILLINFILLILFISVPIFLPYKYFSDYELWTYIITKIITLCLFAAIFIYVFVAKQAQGNIFYLVIFTILLQLLPLSIRLLSFINDYNYFMIASVILISLVSISYIFIVFYFIAQGRKMIKSDNKFMAKSIEVKSENDYLDNNNRFNK